MLEPLPTPSLTQARCTAGRAPCATVARSARRVRRATVWRSPRYRGSTRELRGAVLRAMLADPPPSNIDELQQRAGSPAESRTATDISLVLDTLVHEGLVIPFPRIVRIK